MNQAYRTRKSNFKKRITDYFENAKGEFHLEPKLDKNGRELPGLTQVIWDRPPEQITVSGLALSIGFKSLDTFYDYLSNGEHAETLSWALLHIVAAYEQKLHGPSHSGAIFALKLMGFHEREALKVKNDAKNNTMMVKILDSGPQPAGSENEVAL